MRIGIRIGIGIGIGIRIEIRIGIRDRQRIGIGIGIRIMISLRNVRLGNFVLEISLGNFSSRISGLWNWTPEVGGNADRGWGEMMII